MSVFQLNSKFKPTGDQPEAIKALVDGLNSGRSRYQTLLGVTGSGKTFTIANVIEKIGKPTIILSHNKTLAAQLYGEFKSFFPDNAVEYFVSYYDYYQPESYLPASDLYIEKDLAINAELDKLRLRTTMSLMSGRQDIIIVSSVSCIYGMGNPSAYIEKRIEIKQGSRIDRESLLRSLVDAYYIHNKAEFLPGNFRAKGDTIDIFPAEENYDGIAYRIELWGDEVDRITRFRPLTGKELGGLPSLSLYPATLFVTSSELLSQAIKQIQKDLEIQVNLFEREGKLLEAKRLNERVSYDIEMMKEVGYCSGIENYSRYFDGRAPGEKPYCLFDYFPSDFLLVIDESHVTIPQVKAMYGGDRARKTNLVEYGFRLPAAIDNRPLKFEEFEEIIGDTIFVSATPADYELEKSGGVVVEQVIRPTGLPDPVIEIHPTLNQIDHLMEEVRKRVEADERVLITTLTKKMAEELSEYLSQAGIKCEYIHSDVDTLRRVEIMEGLRSGEFDVLVGVNLLREGLDLPEVSLVAILDADKEGFLRSHRSLTQTAGRAARNLNGRVIFYADTITASMALTIEETQRRRNKQLEYNKKHGITPKQIVKNSASILDLTGAPTGKKADSKAASYSFKATDTAMVAEQAESAYVSAQQLSEKISAAKSAMEKAAKALDFISAAQWRDEYFRLSALQENQKG
ncbi:excinuclease ABC subunit UvrB [Porphyromonas sp. COT-108 OH1349]|uniref:excinuclease ABC subunit UvrB n=1 Tax=Porphyromonas sp. COT-108 OH1349 TaxID=1537504 RepID=UPI00052DA784|nr:excinuclease ABC subunit UvrB [Porphyromonas sp. COT-108 OH1349]KGN67494.1 excinuclease ABC subunit B [Porphyromonas sp. COT-108 OH1349]